MKALFLILLFLLNVPQAFADTVHHDLSISLNPKEGSLSVTDRISFFKEQRKVKFLLHKGLNLEIIEWEGNKEKPKILKSEPFSDHLDFFLIELPAEIRSITLRYSGVIRHPLDPEEKEMARGFRMTKGIISEEGIYLSGLSGWYPLFENRSVTFTLKVDLPEGWRSISQGERVIDGKYEIWKEHNPQEEIYLIGNRFIEYKKKYKDIELMVFLRSPEKELSERYLNATSKYINIYERLIGEYPYKKFALVENFWETGLGMPSFTLLGPKIIRFPFIIDTSYPHEILHNWWGNSVYPDLSEGNWSEGLTAYLSDYLFKEKKGEDTEYRLTTLQKFTDYVRDEKDIPIKHFRMRHSPQEEAIGYGKTLMFFHMLRQKIGDSIFIEGLREFYRRHGFHYASFDDLRKAFEDVSNLDLKEEFDQWINRTGAPLIELKEATVEKKDDLFLLRVKLSQTQKEEPFNIKIPVKITTEKGIFYEVLPMKKRQEEFLMEFRLKPLKIDIDPYYDIMRRLHRDEIPPSISQVLGSKDLLIINPSEGNVKIYKRLSELLKFSATGNVQIKEDSLIEALPKDRSLVILGWENRLLKEIYDAFTKYDLIITEKEVKFPQNEIKKDGHSFVITIKNPFDKDHAILFISTKNPEGIGRKLPHYHKYSYLVFKEDELVNILKGRWQAIDSPLSRTFVDREIPFFETKRIRLLDSLSIDRMFETIKDLSHEGMEGRKPNSEGFKKAKNYLIKRFKESDMEPHLDEKDNIYATLRGKNERCIILGAHYDHLGKGYPGADDNASGVSIVLELANFFKNKSKDLNKSLLFVIFSEEEDGRIGSKFFVKNFKDIDKCGAMINLDTLGRLNNKKLLIIGSQSSEDWVDILNEVSKDSGLDIDLVKEELDASDNISFEEISIPAIQMTSGPHPDYHKKSDTPEKIDKYGLLKILNFTRELIYKIDERDLRFTKKIKAPLNEINKKRRVSLGTIPDFTFKGTGFMIEDVLKNSPAERVGLKKGDIIISVNGHPISSVKDLSDVLKRHQPGDKIRIKILREEKEIEKEVELVERESL